MVGLLGCYIITELIRLGEFRDVTNQISSLPWRYQTNKSPSQVWPPLHLWKKPEWGKYMACHV